MAKKWIGENAAGMRRAQRLSGDTTYRLAILNERGDVIETIDLAEYDLTKTIARSMLVNEILESVRRDAQQEIESANDY